MHELDLGCQRILRWLSRYPLQRREDLVLALAPWEAHGAVSRRLARLNALHLVESLPMGLSPGKPLWHLSPAGVEVCAGWQEASPPTFSASREELVRLLPRLPTLLVIQELVNGLVAGTPQALTRLGRQAEMVRWNWLRDAAERFVPHGEEKARVLRLEGVLALCVRYGSLAGVSEEPCWQTFLLWYCPLADTRLLRVRVDRLLRFRETHPEQMDVPVLIVAQDARQAERWQATCREVAARLHTEPPEGAITLLPPDLSALESWRLSWRRIGTGDSCHLQELVRFEAIPALPHLVDEPQSILPPRTEGRAHREADRSWSVPAYRGRRSFGLVHSLEKRKGDARLASTTLVRRQWEILLTLHAHPLLTHEDLGVLLEMRSRWVQRLLKDLAHKEFLQRALTPLGERWHLAEAGLRLLARAASCSVARLARMPEETGGPMRQRAVTGLLHQIQHTAGVYGFVTTLAQALEGLPDAGLRFWETGAACERVFVYREKTLHFKPDALVCVHLGARELRFWLEWDRGTMGARDLDSKCATYATYLTSREWAREATTPPALVWVMPDIAQERRVIREAQGLLAHLPGLHLWTTTAGLLMTQGILAPIWQQIEWHTERSPPEPSERMTLLGMTGIPCGE
jgi:hypothetical protein